MRFASAHRPGDEGDEDKENNSYLLTQDSAPKIGWLLSIHAQE